jgi:hypothetical protein
MKKLITTIILSGLFMTAFAQQNYNPIHFTKVLTTNPESERKIEGDINIKMKDSVILINENPVKTLRIIQVDPEQTAVTETHITVMWVAFLCTTPDGKSCTVTVVRQKEPGKNDIMAVKAQYGNDDNTFTTYNCTYLKDLY